MRGKDLSNHALLMSSIDEVRSMLDCMMYGDPDLSDTMRARYRKAYDLICQAKDAL